MINSRSLKEEKTISTLKKICYLNEPMINRHDHVSTGVVVSVSGMNCDWFLQFLHISLVLAMKYLWYGIIQ